jgi:hypothetical protein
MKRTPDLLLIDASRGRLITFIKADETSDRWIEMPVWFELDSTSRIRTKLKPANPWRLEEYRFEGETLVFDNPSGVSGWGSIPSEECPDWFWSRIEKSNLRMDMREAGNR